MSSSTLPFTHLLSHMHFIRMPWYRKVKRARFPVLSCFISLPIIQRACHTSPHAPKPPLPPQSILLCHIFYTHRTNRNQSLLTVMQLSWHHADLFVPYTVHMPGRQAGERSLFKQSQLIHARAGSWQRAGILYVLTFYFFYLLWCGERYIPLCLTEPKRGPKRWW